ncbi:MAG: PKD domain-containing protein, partial [Methanoregula sp.]|nr:PKD domain-containing protein [Methanoregula sp.]
MKLFAESRGYVVISNYNQYIFGYNSNTQGFTYTQYKAEIDAGYPVLIQIDGHTMLGVGYSGTNQLIVHDTWDYVDHTMTWGGSYSGMAHYGVTVFHLANIPPTVTGISPVSGTTAGGTSVTITGTGFTGATSVKFGSTAASSWTINSATSITATSPAHAAETVDVTVTTPVGTSATSPVDRFTYAAPAPVANFFGTPTYGTAPLTVTFTDTSTNTPTSWNWNLGDGSTSTEKNPVHTYASIGYYTVSLIATNSTGTNSLTKPDYIHVTNLSDDYTFISTWNGSGSFGGNFIYPHGVAVDSGGNVYVADTENSRIQKFNSAGAFITKWGSLGLKDGDFSYPHDVAVDSSGNVYVADFGNNRTQKFSSSGVFLAKWGL